MFLLPLSCLFYALLVQFQPDGHGTIRHVLRATTTGDGDVGSTSPVPPPPPVSVPVWSLAVPCQRNRVSPSSYVEDATLPPTSMNIVTFATPVSVSNAPKYWIVSLYYDTLTKDCFCDDAQEGVLQLLRPSHKYLVPLLGKRSGKEPDYSKAAACREVGMAWVPSSTGDDGATTTAAAAFGPPHVALLPQCATYLHLRMVSSSSSSLEAAAQQACSTMDAGDHLVLLCQVVATGRWDDASQRVVPISSSSFLDAKDDDDKDAPLDQRNVLYTGLLRETGILS